MALVDRSRSWAGRFSACGLGNGRGLLGVLAVALALVFSLTPYCLSKEPASGTARAQESSSVKVLHLPGGVELALVYCRPGTFVMGSPKNELGRCFDERSHKVKIAKGYYLGRNEVTREQYRAVLGGNSSHFEGDGRCPVDNVTWHQAREFCQKLEALCGEQLADQYKFTLPSEAQWEYACRAGVTTSLNSGRNLTSCDGSCPNLDKLAWYSENSQEKSHPVAQKSPNAWGFYDMHGNIWEWCLDAYNGEYNAKAGFVSGEGQTVLRVLRGGSWYACADHCRCATRFYAEPGEHNNLYGFRLAAISTK